MSFHSVGTGLGVDVPNYHPALFIICAGAVGDSRDHPTDLAHVLRLEHPAVRNYNGCVPVFERNEGCMEHGVFQNLGAIDGSLNSAKWQHETFLLIEKTQSGSLIIC